MKLAHVVSAVNNNPKYLKLLPLFIESWKHFFPEIKITVIYVTDGDELLPAKYMKYIEHIFHYKAPKGLNSVYVAQVVRLLWPALLDEAGGVMPTDIDLIPTCRHYFEGIYDDCAMICYRNVDMAMLWRHINICYNQMTSATWKEMFDIHSVPDIDEFLVNHYPQKFTGRHGSDAEGWYTDQGIFFARAEAWKKKGNIIKMLADSDLKFKRIDPSDHNYDIKKFIELIASKKYTDAHIYANECPWNVNDIDTICKMLG